MGDTEEVVAEHMTLEKIGLQLLKLDQLDVISGDL